MSKWWHQVSAAVLAAALVMLSTVPALASGNVSITRTFQPSSADAWIKSGSPDGNFGSDTTMDTNTARNSLVRHDISTIPASSNVTSASLGLYVTSIAYGDVSKYRTVGAHRVLLDPVDGDWVEGTVTWNLPGSTADVNYAATATNTIDIYGGAGNANQFYNWAVTTDVSNFVAGTQTNYGWRMIDDGGSSGMTSTAVVYATKEYATAADYPKLAVTFTAPWDSYESDYTTGRETYTGSYSTVYMRGTGFSDISYLIAYYDNGGAKRGSETKSASGGVLDSVYLLTSDETAAPGTWHALVQPSSGYTPFGTDSYATIVASPDTYGLVANDSFTVESSAIPEFPTVMAAIGVAGLCFGIYWWMRKRRLAYVQA